MNFNYRMIIEITIVNIDAPAVAISGDASDAVSLFIKLELIVELLGNSVSF